MDRQIILDCQTKNAILHCEDCIAYPTCETRNLINIEKEERGIAVVNSETVGVWKKWKTRKSLPP